MNVDDNFVNKHLSIKRERDQLEQKLDIALHGLKRLADVSDDFVYSRAFYCCEFAQGIINRVNQVGGGNNVQRATETH